ncbi:MAG: heme-copper oxidase subunit III [Dehalococcoidia bacterium]
MAVIAKAGPHHPSAVRLNRIGLWLFFFSESIIFGLLLSARFFLEGIHQEHVDQHLGLAITIVLLLSSVTAFTAETAIEKGNSRLCHWMLLATIALGLIFAAGVAYEWKTAEFSRNESFGTVFFTMTGIHAAHVVSGIAFLAMAWNLARKNRFDAKGHWGISGTVMYWHFVDVVWVFFYPALYLVGS